MLYTFGLRTPAPAAGAAYFDVLNTAANGFFLQKLIATNTTGTAVSVALMISANTPVQTSGVSLLAMGEGSTSVQTIATAWSTAPTLATFNERQTIGASVGAGYVWAYGPRDFWVPASKSIVLWNPAGLTSQILDVTIQIDA